MKFGISYKTIILSFLLALTFLSMPLVKEKEPEKYNAVIRIINQNNYTYCSATVVSNEIAITAAHCIAPYQRYVFISNENRTENFTTVVYSVIDSIDQAILVGDFTKFNKLNLKSKLNGIAESKGPFLTCGYPYNGDLICFKYKPLGIYFFMLKGQSYLYSGMSGGALIDSSNTIVGVNSAVKDDYVLHSPLVNTWSKHGIK